jgi:hypothetical protein
LKNHHSVSQMRTHRMVVWGLGHKRNCWCVREEVTFCWCVHTISRRPSDLNMKSRAERAGRASISSSSLRFPLHHQAHMHAFVVKHSSIMMRIRDDELPADWSAFVEMFFSPGRSHPLARVHAYLCVCMEMERSCSFPGLGLKAVSVSPSWTAKFLLLLASPAIRALSCRKGQFVFLR